MRDPHFEFITTADGSPSMCWTNAEHRSEAMHHRKGALTESLFIYLEALKQSQGFGWPSRILSVGLGCAYNELLTIAHLLNTGDRWQDFYMESFEREPVLHDGFQAWLLNSQCTTRISQTFSQVAKVIAEHFLLEPSYLHEKARNLWLDKKWLIRSALDADTVFQKRFHTIYFDAFSSKATPELWDEEFLIEFIHNCASPECVFTTYAATGTLNRALKKTGFELLPQSGFAGKRESTRAVRHRP